ncbi:MAG TPA: glycine cleavage system protein GcvH [Bacteroidales bacterium]|nr:glycine cleavage system protein GcvH [Bacteroidales bacterium]
MNIQDNLKYTKDHEWVLLNGDEALIGITDFAQGELGDIVFIEVETLGEALEKEEVFGTIEAVKTVSDLFMPLSGEVIEFNDALEATPELINTDPYGKGWIIKVKASNLDEVKDLLSSEEYREMVEG